MKREGQKRDVFERYIGEISRACEAIVGADAEALYESLMKQAKRRTEIADAVLDEDGKIVGFADGNGRLDGDDGVIIVDGNGEPKEPGAPATGQKKLNAEVAKDSEKGTSENEVVEPNRASKKSGKKKVVKKKVKKKVRKKRTPEAAGLFEGE